MLPVRLNASWTAESSWRWCASWRGPGNTRRYGSEPQMAQFSVWSVTVAAASWLSSRAPICDHCSRMLLAISGVLILPTPPGRRDSRSGSLWWASWMSLRCLGTDRELPLPPVVR